MSQQPNSAPLIQVKNLYKIFGPKDKQVLTKVKAGQSKDAILAETGHTVGLSDINLNIYAGEIFVIMGLSGSGKSTLIRHFNRLIEPTEGSIIIEDTDVMTLNASQLQDFRRHKMSMVFQRFGLMPHRTVLQNVGYGLSVQGAKPAQWQQQAQQWLTTVGLAGYEQSYPANLSGGQQQRVGLARALCTNAEVLLMDEAFSALDPLIRSEMQDQLIELQEKLHKTIIFITHDLDEALRLGDRIAILRDGKLIQQGKPVDILLNPADDYVEAFVKDVNRARALTVATVMKPQGVRISAETIGEAVAEMRNAKDDYGYFIDDDGYQGVITQQTLEDVNEADYSKAIDQSMLETVPAITTDALLETVIPETLDSDHPLPVINEAGDMTGRLSRSTLAEALSDQAVSRQ
ncbi:glycine betaine/L-proline ABC transporter ATP-binding protein [Photobacterium aquimaris]|uniref:Quaternary amine transport ATP-binding protein n=1 Tax=Photobacterium aquimaris TaxID=512643 RepID=A0A2T3IQ24_9GAMM|nr:MULTISPECIES: glycine betaine/L-proline ABC transporter ATP-binding protein [Photobacterium]OBU17159.1 glycine betaine/L-proline ABC transporter ATP-binding protein [Photobacterium aquimaris]OBU18044.1 glycine betaine/L-proline ABC transporter ATP-binding protein [Photobacterium aquimaris]PSU30431.1 glycine betaine/L-proline ABC transporter ATP-binding protein [Photobacterium aquimaris]PSW00407.1 glycine betaine/L-proline ABC transporter ATP-binding protein [Photobacterium aquimaris]